MGASFSGFAEQKEDMPDADGGGNNDSNNNGSTDDLEEERKILLTLPEAPMALTENNKLEFTSDLPQHYIFCLHTITSAEDILRLAKSLHGPVLKYRNHDFSYYIPFEAKTFPSITSTAFDNLEKEANQRFYSVRRVTNGIFMAKTTNYANDQGIYLRRSGNPIYSYLKMHIRYILQGSPSLLDQINYADYYYDKVTRHINSWLAEPQLNQRIIPDVVVTETITSDVVIHEIIPRTFSPAKGNSFSPEQWFVIVFYTKNVTALLKVCNSIAKLKSQDNTLVLIFFDNKELALREEKYALELLRYASTNYGSVDNASVLRVFGGLLFASHTIKSKYDLIIWGETKLNFVNAATKVKYDSDIAMTYNYNSKVLMCSNPKKAKLVSNFFDLHNETGLYSSTFEYFIADAPALVYSDDVLNAKIMVYCNAQSSQEFDWLVMQLISNIVALSTTCSFVGVVAVTNEFQLNIAEGLLASMREKDSIAFRKSNIFPNVYYLHVIDPRLIQLNEDVTSKCLRITVPKYAPSPDIPIVNETIQITVEPSSETRPLASLPIVDITFGKQTTTLMKLSDSLRLSNNFEFVNYKNKFTKSASFQYSPNVNLQRLYMKPNFKKNQHLIIFCRNISIGKLNSIYDLYNAENRTAMTLFFTFDDNIDYTALDLKGLIYDNVWIETNSAKRQLIPDQLFLVKMFVPYEGTNTTIAAKPMFVLSTLQIELQMNLVTLKDPKTNAQMTIYFAYDKDKQYIDFPKGHSIDLDALHCDVLVPLIPIPVSKDNENASNGILNVINAGEEYILLTENTTKVSFLSNTERPLFNNKNILFLQMNTINEQLNLHPNFDTNFSKISNQLVFNYIYKCSGEYLKNIIPLYIHFVTQHPYQWWFLFVRLPIHESLTPTLLQEYQKQLKESNCCCDIVTNEHSVFYLLSRLIKEPNTVLTAQPTLTKVAEDILLTLITPNTAISVCLMAVFNATANAANSNRFTFDMNADSLVCELFKPEFTVRNLTIFENNFNMGVALTGIVDDLTGTFVTKPDISVKQSTLVLYHMQLEPRAISDCVDFLKTLATSRPNEVLGYVAVFLSIAHIMPFVETAFTETLKNALTTTEDDHPWTVYPLMNYEYFVTNATFQANPGELMLSRGSPNGETAFFPIKLKDIDVDYAAETLPPHNLEVILLRTTNDKRALSLSRLSRFRITDTIMRNTVSMIERRTNTNNIPGILYEITRTFMFKGTMNSTQLTFYANYRVDPCFSIQHFLLAKVDASTVSELVNLLRLQPNNTPPRLFICNLASGTQKYLGPFFNKTISGWVWCLRDNLLILGYHKTFVSAALTLNSQGTSIATVHWRVTANPNNSARMYTIALPTEKQVQTTLPNMGYPDVDLVISQDKMTSLASQITKNLGYGYFIKTITDSTMKIALRAAQVFSSIPCGQMQSRRRERNDVQISPLLTLTDSIVLYPPCDTLPTCPTNAMMFILSSNTNQSEAEVPINTFLLTQLESMKNRGCIICTAVPIQFNTHAELVVGGGFAETRLQYSVDTLSDYSFASYRYIYCVHFSKSIQVTQGSSGGPNDTRDNIVSHLKCSGTGFSVYFGDTTIENTESIPQLAFIPGDIKLLDITKPKYKLASVYTPIVVNEATFNLITVYEG